MGFSEKISLVRDHYRLSQEEMADKLNVSRQTISKWESGISYPEVDKLITISEIFGVSIDYLLKENYKEPVQKDALERVVLQFLGASQDMNKISEQLIDIMRDGIIDANERIQMEQIVCMLDEVSENISQLKSMIANRKEMEEFL